MPIITLTTDLGETDYYAGSVKGALLSQCPGCTVVDISHAINPFDVYHAAYVIGNAWYSFPFGTVHLVHVDHSQVRTQRLLVFEEQGHYFIGPDNGLLSLVFRLQPGRIYAPEGHTEGAFVLRDYMVPLAAQLLSGHPPEDLGNPVHEPELLQRIEPVTGPQSIRGNVMYLDHYGNALTNISLELMQAISQGRRFTISFKRNESITQLSGSYDEVPEGEKLALINAAGLLEIAINKGNAAQLIGFVKGDRIQIDFNA